MMRKVISRTTARLALLMALSLLAVLPAQADPGYDPACDIDRNGVINIVDIMTVAAHWRETGTWYCFCDGGSIACSDCDSRFVNVTGDSMSGSSDSAMLQVKNTATGAGAGVKGEGHVYGVIGQGGSIGVSGSGDLIGVTGSGTSAAGVYGSSSGGYGVYGSSTSTSGRGVYGQASASSGETYGVYGEANSPDGRGVYGTSSSGHGVHGYSASSYGVYGETASTDPNIAGVYGHNDGSGTGVIGRSSSGPGVFASGSPAVWGMSDSGTGVLGWGLGSDPGVKGFSIDGYGVRASSTNNTALYASTSSGDGVRGDSSSGAGVSGWSGSGSGVAGFSNSSYGVFGWGFGNKAGVYGESEGGPGVYGFGRSGGGYFESLSADGLYSKASAGAMWGVWGTSVQSYGVLGNTDVSGGYGLYTNDKCYCGGGCVDCTSMLIAQNGDDEPLELGDVVVVSGIADPISPEAMRPTLVVRKADFASSQGVVGVVEGRYVSKLVTKRIVRLEHAEEKTSPETGRPAIPAIKERMEEVIVEDAHTTEESAAPGEYLTVVYRGLARVKVDASLGAVRAGDLLTSSSTMGHVMKAGLMATQGEKSIGGYLPGTIIGKALEPLEADKDLIWVLVDLQ